MPTPGPLELVIILVIALLILGPGKLPDVGAALGKSIREFRKASTDVQEAVKIDTSPMAPAASSAANVPAPQTPAAPPAAQPAAAEPAADQTPEPGAQTPAAPPAQADPAEPVGAASEPTSGRT